MSNLPTLIADLALILLCAGVMTLLFKKLSGRRREAELDSAHL